MNNEDLLDKIKLKIFTSRNIEAFMGPLLCNITWKWSYDIPTAATNYKTIIFNPDFLSSMSLDLAVSVALHELNHIFRLHDIRQGTRDPRRWNEACDYIINFGLSRDGFPVGDDWLHDPNMLIQNGLESEEEVYKFLEERGDEPNVKSFGHPDEEGDMEEFDGTEQERAAQEKELIDAVSSAITQAALTGNPGKLAGEMREFLDVFVNPVIPWNVALRKYFIEVGGEIKNTWSRRNRRYPKHYMPKRVRDKSSLTKVMFFLDTSGSVSNEELLEYLSEIRFVQDNLKPEELRIIQFDHNIQKEDVYREGDKIDSIEVVGRGGTSLEPVWEMIEGEKPSVAVIFSDLECYGVPDPKVPIIWITKETPYSWKPDYGDQYIIK